jgi:hypothetical protein
MRRKLFLCLMVFLMPAVGAAADDDRLVPDPVGIWRGELDRGDHAGKPLLVVLRLRSSAEGYAATIEGFGLDAGNSRVQNLSLIEDVLSFQVPQVQGRFAGNVYGDSIRGTWSQGDESRPLIFFRD